MTRRKPAYPTRAQLEERNYWICDRVFCWICGKAPVCLQVHEIASRAQAPLKWACVENYFAACERCNMHVLNNVPEALQLCYKKYFDPANYNRVLINRLRGEADNSISESEVNIWSDYVKAVSR